MIYFRELSERAATGLDPVAEIPADDDLAGERGVFLVAHLRGRPVGCCGLRRLEVTSGAGEGEDGGAGGLGEVKRMWVDPEVRGLGVGRRLLEEVERRAREWALTALRLDTNEHLTEAITMYRSSGYREIERYTEESRSRRTGSRSRCCHCHRVPDRGIPLGAPCAYRREVGIMTVLVVRARRNHPFPFRTRK